MHPSASPRALPLIASSLLMAVLFGCSSGVAGSGGGGGGSPVMVTVSGPSTDRLGATAQFNATVTGATNHAVTWGVNGTAGGSTSVGTISSAGLYTAPAAMPSQPSVTVTAVSQASASASGMATLGLQNPLPVITGASASQIGSTLNYAVDIVGTGFVPSSAINAAGSAQATTYVSATELRATVAVASGTTDLALSVTNPDPGGSTSSVTNVNITFYNTTAISAARLLDQATFGPATADIQHLQQIGIAAYLQEQFSTPTTLLAAIPTNPLPPQCLGSNNPTPCAESEWWQTAVTAPDQLRQRVALALSMMFVVSTQSIPGQAVPAYHNMLANDAFGNFATIMHDVTLSPAMGDYLNMLDSAAPAAGQIANENYPRENMQLFTIGLSELNQDGTLQLDGSGNPIPNYTQATVQAFARAYTGWTFAHADGSQVTKFPNKTADYNDPMVAVESAHDTTTKTLLNGTVLPGGQTAEQDLSGALANIFNHPNVGPFVCRQLIQHLVTSTPSPAYVARIAAVFANNGSGVRGDMKAVITAILTDAEARAGDANFDGGHLRDPFLFITGMMRALAFTNTDANASWYSLSTQSNNLSMRPYRANSVFNFYPPEYVIPGTTLNAPEFSIENTATATLRLTLADAIVNNKISGFKVDLSNTSTFGSLAANPAALVSALNTLLMHSQMPTAMQTAIVNAITPLSSNAQRARVAIYLIITSSQYKIIH